MKQRLTEEQTLLEAELATIGQKSATTPGDWVATPAPMDGTEPDEVADKIEQFEENTALLKQLEIRLSDIKLALTKIEQGTFGVCEISGEPIEEDRLEANPSARTCKAHMDDEEALVS